jgi:hypothetical protein
MKDIIVDLDNGQSGAVPWDSVWKMSDREAEKLRRQAERIDRAQSPVNPNLKHARILTDDARAQLVYDAKTAVAIAHEANDFANKISGDYAIGVATSIFGEIRRMRRASPDYVPGYDFMNKTEEI